MAAASVILEAAVLDLGHVVSVGGTREALGSLVVSAADILVGDDYAQRGARGETVEDAAQDLVPVLFPAGRVHRPLRPSFGQLGGYEILVHGYSRRKAVNHGSYRRPVGLPEQCEDYVGSDAVLHYLAFL